MTTTTGRTPAGSQRDPAATTVELTRSVRVAGGQEEVFDLVSDVNRAHEWRTEVVESSMSPDGPMRRSTRLRLTAPRTVDGSLRALARAVRAATASTPRTP